MGMVMVGVEYPKRCMSVQVIQETLKSHSKGPEDRD